MLTVRVVVGRRKLREDKWLQLLFLALKQTAFKHKSAKIALQPYKLTSEGPIAVFIKVF
jgi:hypothetical protein